MSEQPRPSFIRTCPTSLAISLTPKLGGKGMKCCTNSSIVAVVDLASCKSSGARAAVSHHGAPQKPSNNVKMLLRPSVASGHVDMAPLANNFKAKRKASPTLPSSTRSCSRCSSSILLDARRKSCPDAQASLTHCSQQYVARQKLHSPEVWTSSASFCLQGRWALGLTRDGPTILQS